mmetsp:Transcript_12489/g.35573  ORF Transcript_12489/g.35573 Transcript_12489/m.35573 type:complete len:177 (-) Transcript_12489:180-710(-)
MSSWRNLSFISSARFCASSRRNWYWDMTEVLGRSTGGSRVVRARVSLGEPEIPLMRGEEAHGLEQGLELGRGETEGGLVVDADGGRGDSPSGNSEAGIDCRPLGESADSSRPTARENCLGAARCPMRSVSIEGRVRREGVLRRGSEATGRNVLDVLRRRDGLSGSPGNVSREVLLR